MTLDDELTQAEYLEQLARAVKAMDSRIGVFEREKLEALLGEPGGVRVGSPGIPVMSLGASDIDRTLGNVAPFFGQTNRLKDPALEHFGLVNPIALTANTNGLWRALYILNSGTAPTTRTLNLSKSRFANDTSLNSGTGLLELSGFASGSTTYHVYPSTTSTEVDVVTLPFLVAAVRVGDFGVLSSTLTNITSISVSVEIIDSSDGSTLAESPILDFKALVGRRPALDQLIAAYGGTTGTTFRWRLKVVVVASGAGGTVRIYFGEPQLHYAYSPDANPFAPQLGRWNPQPDTDTSFPAGPLPNDLFYRTDLDMLFFFDGTQWLCTCPHTAQLTQIRTIPAPLTATQTAARECGKPSLQGGSDLWIESLLVTFFITGGTALGASHKWVGTLNKVNSANANTVIATTNIDSGASDTYRTIETAIDALYGSFFAMRSDWTKTGTPGSLTWMEEVSYRIVAT